MNILLISGEVSGDRYAAHLANTLLSDFPQTRLFGIGGDHLKHTVHEFVFESAYSHGVGIESMFFNSRFKRNLLSSLKQTLTKSRIDRVIIIDFQHYNEVIATCINSFNIPIYTFITPNFWMWKSTKEAQKIERGPHRRNLVEPEPSPLSLRVSDSSKSTYTATR